MRHPLASILLSLTIAPAAWVTAQERTAPAAATWSPNLLAEVAPAKRTTSDVPLALPALAAGDASYRVRVTATLLQGGGPLQVWVPTGADNPVRLVSKQPQVGGAVDFEWTVRGKTVTVQRDAWVVALAPSERAPQTTTLAATATEGRYRLESLQVLRTNATEKPTSPPTRAVAPSVATPDALAQLDAKKRWPGRVRGDRREMDCTLVILERSATSLTFRMETEAGGWFRFECSVKDGKVTVTNITHTKDARNGPRAIIDEPKGHGRIDTKAFVLDYSYQNAHAGQKGTVTGKITIPLQ